MTRLKTLAICLVAVFAIGVVAAATASAETPEFGRCIKKAPKTEGAGFSNAGCTNAVSSGAKYEWKAGPGENPHFTSTARFVGTANYKHCLLASEEEGRGNYKRAEEIYAKYGLSKSICEPILAEKEADEPALLETTSGLRVECSGVSSTGEYSMTNTQQVANVKTTFTGCEFDETGLTCQSAGAASGEVLTSTLDGTLGVIKKEPSPLNTTVGLALYPASGEVVAELECAGFAKTVVTGSVIHQVATNKMVSEEVEKFLQRKGIQKPESFEGAAQDVLFSAINGGTPVQAGEALLTTLVNVEKIEVNTVV
jgi:hypothetical protein